MSARIFGTCHRGAQLKIARGCGFTPLESERVAVWLRPFVDAANEAAFRLIEEASPPGDYPGRRLSWSVAPSLLYLIERVAVTLLLARGWEARAVKSGSAKVQASARRWIEAHRKATLAFRAARLRSDELAVARRQSGTDAAWLYGRDALFGATPAVKPRPSSGGGPS